MPIKQFVTGPDGAELTLDDNAVGTEQTCQECGAPIARREVTGEVTVDALRYVGSAKIAVVVPTGTPNVNPNVVRTEGSFELCHPCALILFGPLGLVPEEAVAAPAPEPIERPDVDEHQGAELGTAITIGEAAAVLGVQATPETRMVAILGRDGRDSGFTAFETPGERVRYIDVHGAAITEEAMRAELDKRAAAAAEPVAAAAAD
jgi:hypothetical protein